MLGEKDRYIDFLEEMRKYPGGWDAVFSILDSWTNSTDVAYQPLLDEIAETWGIENYAPWDVAYVRYEFQTRINDEYADAFGIGEMHERLRATLKGLGFSEAERAIRCFSKPHLSQEELGSLVHGTITVRDHGNRQLRQFGKYNDASLMGLADIETNLHEDGVGTYRILFHEVGHALHHLNIRSKYHMLRTAFPKYFSEAVAQVVEFLVIDVAWLGEVCGMRPESAARLRRLVVSLELQKMRENTMWAFYENEIHANQSVARRDVWRRLARRFLYPRTDLESAPGEREYEERLMYFPYSALQIALTILIREHLRRALSQDGTMFTTRAGEMLKEIFSFGGSEHWTTVVEKVTGEPFSGESAANTFNSLLESKS